MSGVSGVRGEEVRGDDVVSTGRGGGVWGGASEKSAHLAQPDDVLVTEILEERHLAKGRHGHALVVVVETHLAVSQLRVMCPPMCMCMCNY